MTLDDIQHAVQIAAGPSPIMRSTYQSIADRAFGMLDRTDLAQEDAQLLWQQAQHMNTPDDWLDIACERVAAKLKKAVN
jgi:hypothetical protein